MKNPYPVTAEGMMQRRQDIQSCFADGAGARILGWLIYTYHNGTSFSPDPYITAFNEGQRNVIVGLLKLKEMEYDELRERYPDPAATDS